MPSDKDLEELSKELDEMESADEKTAQPDAAEIDEAAKAVETQAIEVVLDTPDETASDEEKTDEAADEVIAVAIKMDDEATEEAEPEAPEGEEADEPTEEKVDESDETSDNNQEVQPKVEPSEPESDDSVKDDETIEELQERSEREKDMALEKAVDEIVHHEGEENLKAEDAKMMAAFSPAASRWGRFKDWFSHPRNRYGVIGGVVAVLVLILALPTTRYGVFNSIGVRGSLEVTVLDEDSGLPLKNVSVTIDEQTAETDKEGQALVTGIRLGNQDLVIEKLAYASHSTSVNIGTGTNQLEDIELNPTGTQYSFVLNDWLSNTPLEGAEIAYGENSVLSNVDGESLLTIPPTSDEEFEVLITAEGYRSETVTVATTEQAVQEVKLVVDEKHYFISKRTGKYNLYKVDLDGTNEELVLEGTGKENSNLQLLDMSDKRSIFLVSSREGKRNSDDSPLYGLFQIDSESGEFERIDESESIRLYGTSRDRLVYVKVKAGASASNPSRQRLLSYDPVSGRNIEIASTNYFNSVNVTDTAIFYAPSDLFKTEKAPYLYRVNPQTGEKTTVHAAEVWSIFRTGYSELTFDAKQDWYMVGTASGASPVPLDARPADNSSRLYQLSPNQETAVYIDYRDGKGYLISVNVTSGEEQTVHVQSGMKHPLNWASNNHIVFRVSNSEGTSDQIVDLRGGDAVELTGVTDVASYDRWYYYY